MIRAFIYCVEVCLPDYIGCPHIRFVCVTHLPMHQKYHPTPEWESSSASGLINGESLFWGCLRPCFWSMMHKPSWQIKCAQRMAILFDFQRFEHENVPLLQGLSSAWLKSCQCISVGVLQHSWAHVYLLVALASVFLLKQRDCISSKSWNQKRL